jgi:hypothetical protein
MDKGCLYFSISSTVFERPEQKGVNALKLLHYVDESEIGFSIYAFVERDWIWNGFIYRLLTIKVTRTSIIIIHMHETLLQQCQAKEKPNCLERNLFECTMSDTGPACTALGQTSSSMKRNWRITFWDMTRNLHISFVCFMICNDLVQYSTKLRNTWLCPWAYWEMKQIHT